MATMTKTAQTEFGKRNASSAASGFPRERKTFDVNPATESAPSRGVPPTSTRPSGCPRGLTSPGGRWTPASAWRR
jgi:hypothetical protein